MDNYKVSIMEKLIRIIISLAIALVVCALIGSCKTREIVNERVVYDTVWNVQKVQTAKGDSVVHKELVRIEPRIVYAGDTTIINMDTTIEKTTDRYFYETNNYYIDQGRVSKDSAVTEKKTQPPSPSKDVKKENKWRLWWSCLIIAVLLSLIIQNWKKIVTFVRRLVKRSL